MKDYILHFILGALCTSFIEVFAQNAYISVPLGIVSALVIRYTLIKEVG